MVDTGYRTQPDAAGALAAAVASQFNDELTMMLNCIQASLGLVESGHPAEAELIELQQAALRCAGVTRSLLAFTRRSGPLQPVPLEQALRVL